MENNTQYQWKLKSMAKGIDPDVAMTELQRIEGKHGMLTAEILLDEAMAIDSPLHNLFTWDDSEAARKYRLHEARTIINNISVTVISDGQTKSVDVFEIVSMDGNRSYKDVRTFTIDEAAEVRVRTIRDLNILRNKLAFYQKYNGAANKIAEAIQELSA